MKVVQREQGPFEAIQVKANNLEEIKTFLGSSLCQYLMNREGDIEWVTFYDNYSDYPDSAHRNHWIVKDFSCEGFRSLSLTDFEEQFRIVEDENAESA